MDVIKVQKEKELSVLVIVEPLLCKVDDRTGRTLRAMAFRNKLELTEPPGKTVLFRKI